MPPTPKKYYMNRKKVSDSIAKKVELKKQKTENNKIVIEFRSDFLRDKIIVELIRGYKHLRMLKETFEGMTNDLIPPNSIIQMRVLELYTNSLSNILVA